MKKIAGIFLIAVFLSGCATYKFQHGQPPYDLGYVAARDSYVIPEYTLGKDNSVPEELGLARQRFNARHRRVEDYYKKMGVIENRFKMAAWDPAVMFVKLIGGVFRLPFIAVSDYKYDHNPAYKERVRKLEEEKDLKEEARIARFREQLTFYIQQALDSEKPYLRQAASSKKRKSVEKELTQIEAVADQANLSSAPAPQESLAVNAELDKVQREQKMGQAMQELPPVKHRQQKKEAQASGSELRAVIVAHPQKGFSPLAVHFSGRHSASPSSKIVSYSWDFGDGDTSSKASPVNTYYSGSSQPQEFSVTLTVKDAKGNTATCAATIEVLNK